MNVDTNKEIRRKIYRVHLLAMGFPSKYLTQKNLYDTTNKEESEGLLGSIAAA